MLNIDGEKCKRDGFCVAVCPIKIIVMKDDGSTPRMIRGGERACIRCGHCVAVCPHAALSHEAMATEACPPVKRDRVLTPEQIEYALRSRRSIRVYKDKEVEREKVEALIRIARYAPTGTNSQKIQWLAIDRREDVRRLTVLAFEWMRSLIGGKHPIAEAYRLGDIVRAYDTAGVDLICRDAPALLVTHAPKAYQAAMIDSTIALTFADVAAPSLGLGTCWAGFFMMAASQWPALTEALRLPEDNVPLTAMMLGYPKYPYHRLPLRNEPVITWFER